MSYLATYRRSLRRPMVMGGSIIDTATQAVSAAGKVLEDPALPEVTGIVLRLNALEKSSAKTPTQGKGIGLKYAVPPLKGFLFYRQHPLVVPLGVIALLGGIYYLGFATGKRKRA